MRSEIIKSGHTRPIRPILVKLSLRCIRIRAPLDKAIAPPAFKPRLSFPFHLLTSPYIMPSTLMSRFPLSPDLSTVSLLSPHSAAKDISPLLFDDTTHFESPMSDCDQMIFGPLDYEDRTRYKPSVPFTWDPYAEIEATPFHPPADSHSLSVSLGPSAPVTPPSNPFHDFGIFTSQPAMQPPTLHDHDDNDFYLSNWLNDPEFSVLQVSSSVPQHSHMHESQRSSSCVPFPRYSDCSQESSPEFVALNNLPHCSSPARALDEHRQALGEHMQALGSVSPQETSIQPPPWASHLWDTSGYAPAATPPQMSPSPPAENLRRQRTITRRDTLLFQSSSAPSALNNRPMSLARTYSRRAESASISDDRDATVRRRRRISTNEEPRASDSDRNSPPSKSLLRPPKLAPSAWQLYFTDWIQRQQASSTRKLNVAQAAKEAGQEYAGLSPEEKEPYKRRSQAAKEARERELAAYMRTLTPDDIKRENAFRAAQRKAGKSRKSNIKDPNAPKKPLSAYFMFLQRIRSDPLLVQEVFGDETETTKQSVLAAAKWRSMTDDERKPFLAKAEQEKLNYEAARRLYEEGTVALGSSINFSILPGSTVEPVFRISRVVKVEPGSSESESDEFTTDDGMGTRL